MVSSLNRIGLSKNQKATNNPAKITTITVMINGALDLFFFTAMPFSDIKEALGLLSASLFSAFDASVSISFSIDLALLIGALLIISTLFPQ